MNDISDKLSGKSVLIFNYLALLYYICYCLSYLISYYVEGYVYLVYLLLFNEISYNSVAWTSIYILFKMIKMILNFYKNFFNFILKIMIYKKIE